MNNLISDSNEYSDAFSEFQESKLYDSIVDEFTPQPYYKQFKPLFYTALAASFVFQVFSALTSSTLVYFFTNGMINIPIIAGFITLLFLIILEVSKRETSGKVFRNYLQYKKPSQQLSKGLILVVLCLSTLSVTFSYFGSKKLVLAFTPPPSIASADSLTTELKEQIATINQQIKNAESQTNSKGKILYKVLPTIASLNRQKASIQTRIFEIENRTDGKNDVIELSHHQDTRYKAEYFALFTLLLELAFLGCTYYLKYFKYRSLVEMLTVPPSADESIAVIDEPEEEPEEEPAINQKEEVQEVQEISTPTNIEHPAIPLEIISPAPPAESVAVAAPPSIENKRRAIGFRIGNGDRITVTAGGKKRRHCKRCSTTFTYKHWNKQYCTDVCRQKAWEERTGRKLIKGKKK